MKHVLSILMVALMSLTSCTMAARQASSKQTMNISGDYTALEVYNNIEVKYVVGTPAPAQVEFRNGADPADFSMTVKNGSLILTHKGKGEVKVTLTGSPISAIAVDNNAEVNIEQMLSVTGDLGIAASNNAEVTIAGASCANLHVAAANNAEVKINRVLTSDQVEVACANSSEVKFGHTDCVKLQVAAANNGEAKISWLNSTSASLAAANNAEIEIKGKCPAAEFAASNNATIEVEELAVNHATASATELSTIHCHVGQLTISAQSPHAVIRNK
ncbi:MAG: hypothetical protein ACI4AM_00105 [Muribaculaceae bacterium]